MKPIPAEGQLLTLARGVCRVCGNPEVAREYIQSPKAQWLYEPRVYDAGHGLRVHEGDHGIPAPVCAACFERTARIQAGPRLKAMKEEAKLDAERMEGQISVLKDSKAQRQQLEQYGYEEPYIKEQLEASKARRKTLEAKLKSLKNEWGF